MARIESPSTPISIIEGHATGVYRTVVDAERDIETIDVKRESAMASMLKGADSLLASNRPYTRISLAQPEVTKDQFWNRWLSVQEATVFVEDVV